MKFLFIIMLVFIDFMKITVARKLMKIYKEKWMKKRKLLLRFTGLSFIILLYALYIKCKQIANFFCLMWYNVNIFFSYIFPKHVYFYQRGIFFSPIVGNVYFSWSTSLSYVLKIIFIWIYDSFSGSDPEREKISFGLTLVKAF